MAFQRDSSATTCNSPAGNSTHLLQIETLPWKRLVQNSLKNNGQSGRMIQTMKQMLRKAHEDNRDRYIALLQYRNTPESGFSYLPAQLLMSRRLRNKLPTVSNTLQPKIVQPQQLEARQAWQKYYFDHHTKEMPKLNMEDQVNICHKRVWEKPIVTPIPAGELPRSYNVIQDGGELCRNRFHLMPTHRPNVDNAVNNNITAPPAATPPQGEATRQQTPCSAIQTNNPTIISRGRTVRRPKKYADYVCE